MIDDDLLKQLLHINNELIRLCNRLNGQREITVRLSYNVQIADVFD